jgi:hypothetical protein
LASIAKFSLGDQFLSQGKSWFENGAWPMRGFSRSLLFLGLLVTLAGCLAPLGAALAQCRPGAGPSVSFGSLNLRPTVRKVPPGPTAVPATLAILTFPATSAPPIFELSFPVGKKTVTAKMKTFELCVVPASPSVTILGSRVSGKLEDPGPGAPGAQDWQFFFGGVFLTPLSRTHNGRVVKVDVDAPNANNSIPPGVQPSGRMLITILLRDGPHNLDLTVERR